MKERKKENWAGDDGKASFKTFLNGEDGFGRVFPKKN